MKMYYFVILLLCSVLCTSSCKKEKDLELDECSGRAAFSKSVNEFLDVPNYTRRLAAMNLENEYCLVTKDYIQFISKELEVETFKIPDLYIHEIQVTEYDTIIHMDNSFFRFYPSKKELKHIYTPPYFIQQFHVLPNQGIGYIWSTVFIEPSKFNYFDFSTSTNKTIYRESDFFPEYSIELLNRHFITYLENDSLHMLLKFDKKYIDSGYFYKVNLESKKILETKFYENKEIKHLIGKMDDDLIRIKYETQSSGVYALENPFTNNQHMGFKYPNDYWNSSEQTTLGNYICILDKDYPNPTITLYDWTKEEMLWKIDVNNQDIGLGKIFMSSLGVIFYTSKGNIVEVFTYSDGCLLNKITTNKIVDEVLCSDTESILIVNKNSKYEILKVKN
jgi:hypothetical protein